MKHLLTYVATIALFILSVPFAAGQGANSDALNIVQDYVENGFDETYLSEDVIVYDNPYGVTYYDAVSFTDTYAPFYDASPDFIVANNYNVYGDTVVVDFTYSPDTLASVVDYTGVYEVANGEITRINYYYDPSSYLGVYDYTPVPYPVNYYGMPPELIEQIDENPSAYYDQTITVTGYVSEILTDNIFLMDELQPFDLTPATFMVAAPSEDFFVTSGIDINQDQQVQVTGTFLPLSETELEADIGYQLDEVEFTDFAESDHAVAASWIDVLAPAGGVVTMRPVGVAPYRMTAETAELIEDNPSDFYGETVTVRGDIQSILSEEAFVIQNSEPFDLTPAEFMVIDPTGDIFDNFEVTPNTGETVQVTGTLYEYDMGQLEGQITWGFGETGFAELTGFDSDDFAILIDSIQVVE